MKLRLDILLLALISTPAAAGDSIAREPTALIYSGPGACEEGCVEAAAEIARLEGYTPILVGADEKPQEFWASASAWIQPGGTSNDVARHMNPTLKSWIQNFVKEGAAYVGYCAGGFFSTADIGGRGIAGLGVMPGINRLYEARDENVYITEVTWNGKPRHVYWEGGPYFVLPETPVGQEPTVWPIATYPDGTVAAAQALYGKGRVSVSGPHPEAPTSWRSYYKLDDADGADLDLAREMLRWAIAADQAN